MARGRICGVCEEVKEDFCEECSRRGHFVDRETTMANGSVGKKEVLVTPCLVCTDCCLCPLLNYSMGRGGRA